MQPRFSLGITLCGCLALVGFLSRASGVNVQCKFVEEKPILGGDVLCKCYGVEHTPWSNGSEKTASQPDKANVAFETINGSVHASIRWIQRSSFLSHVKDGFYLELAGDGNLHYSYNCDVKINKINVANETGVEFHFNECCASLERGSGWRPGMELTVIVHARPMYDIESHAYFAMGEGKVPKPKRPPKKSRKKGKKKSKPCKRKNKKCRKKRRPIRVNQPSEVFQKAEEPESSNSKKPLLIIVASVCCFTGILMLSVVLIVLNKYRRIYVLKEMNRSLLIIGENVDEFIPFNNFLIEVIKKNSPAGIKVTSNVRNSIEIANVGISPWITRNIEVADVVIFIITAKEQPLLNAQKLTLSEKQECSNVSIALNIAESLSLKIGCRTSRKKFLALDVYGIANSNSLPFCTHYTLEKDFQNLMRLALRLHYRTNVPDADRLTLLKLSRCDGVVPQENLPQQARNRDESNNLNRSIMYSAIEGRPLLAPNIADDQFPSVENNELR